MRKLLGVTTAVFCVLIIACAFLLQGQYVEEVPGGGVGSHAAAFQNALEGADTADSKELNQEGLSSVEEGGHVPLYQELERFNAMQIFHGLTVSETRLDGKPYYQLTSEEIPELTILVNEEETAATVMYRSGTLQFDIPGAFPAIDTATFGLRDLTGDGIPEVYYFYHSGGTGAYDTIAKVIVDITAMEILEIEPLDSILTALADGIQCTLVSVEGERAIYEMSAGDAGPVLGFSYIKNGNDPSQAQLEVGRDYVQLYVSEEDTLRAVVGFTMSNAAPGTHLGTVYADFLFDELSRTFTIQAPYLIQAESPAA